MGSFQDQRQGGSRRRLVVAGAVAGAAAFAGLFEACSLDSTAVPSLDAGAVEGGASIPLDSGALDAPADAPAEGCAPVESDCLNGIDDDCNGLIDCGDPACAAGYRCVPAPANGFSGFAIYDEAQTTACPPAYPSASATYEALFFLPASCAPCACEAAGARCGPASLSCTPGGSCPTDGGAGVGESCSALDGGIALGALTSCALSPPVAIPGACTAVGGAATLPAPSFGQSSRVCAATAAPGGGCATGLVCVANPPPGSHGACIFDSASTPVQCPAGYPSAHTTVPSATSFADTRACTSCSCGSVGGSKCTGAATLYRGPSCDDAGLGGAPPIALPADGTCTTLTSIAETIGAAVLDAGVVSQGSCVPDGGQPEGVVSLTNPTVYCCQD